MKLLDANILLYAYDSASIQHTACRSWLDDVLNADEVVGLPWQTVLAFLLIGTNPRAVRRPLSATTASDIVQAWLERPNVVVPEPGERFWDILRKHLVEAHIAGPLVTDAALAALAMEQGATLCSVDRDFRRFRGLKLLDPTEP